MSTEMETRPTSGRHADDRTSYMERWAERYPIGQRSVERTRLKQGKAKYRAHRDPLPAKPGKS